MSQRLYVIGNGFDLHHRIPSRYIDFGRYVEATAPEVFGHIREYLAVDDKFWNVFEERLATFDSDTVIDYAEQFLVSYGAEDWSDAYHHDFEYEIQRIVEGLSTDLRRSFAAWVRTLPMPAPDSVPLVRCIDPSARFLSFNYTPTLQHLYGVADSQILHIHGRSTDPDGDIVLGHGWERDVEETLSRQVDEETDTRVAGGYALIDSYSTDTFKPTERIMARNRPFFDGLGSVDEVFVLGHSLADVDAPYIREIIAKVAPSCRWTISFYEEPPPEIERFQKLGGDAAKAVFSTLASL